MLVTFNAYSGSHYISIDDLPIGYQEMFRRNRYLVRDPGEYYLLISMFHQGEAISESRFIEMAGHEASACGNFKADFFEARRELRARNLQAWLGLHPLYTEFVDFLAHVPVPIDIITTKDEKSVNLLLEEYKISEKVGRVFGQEALKIYGGKAGAISEACRLSGVAASKVAYLDDHLQHLEDVRVTGVNLWYATWGYTNPSTSQVPDYIRTLTLERVQEILGGMQ
jgi:hypothetical protein